MTSEDDPKRLAQVALVALLIIGCIAVLLPMIGAILFAFVLWICTWPLYTEKLLPRIEQGLPADPPKFLSDLPLVGGDIATSWQNIASNRAEQLNAALKQLVAPAQRLALATGKIAGVPAAVLLGFATFFLSMIPIGPPLIWGSAAAWLYGEGQTGWAIFLVLYGLFVISSIDNFLKPFLMARGAGISILLIALGVIGGVLVFGFIGLFLGPVLLALGHMLLSRWTHEESSA